jgi:hypothetical protein
MELLCAVLSFSLALVGRDLAQPLVCDGIDPLVRLSTGHLGYKVQI